MSNTSKGKAPKGSKRMMQKITSPPQKNLFDECIKDNLSWLSPLENEDYKEYSLNNKKMLSDLGLDKCDFNDFWPNNQPRWDGIAISTTSKTLYLFEAKSHESELSSCCKAKEAGLETIKNSLGEVAKCMFDLSELPSSWLKPYYQSANRFAFLFKMKELARKEQSKFDYVKLVLVNFVNDPTWDKKHQMTKEEWEKCYNDVFKILEIEKMPEDVIELYYTAPSIDND